MKRTSLTLYRLSARRSYIRKQVSPLVERCDNRGVLAAKQCPAWSPFRAKSLLSKIPPKMIPYLLLIRIGG